MSTLEERYLKRKMEKLTKAQNIRDSIPKEFADRLRKIFQNPKLIELIETNIVEHGAVTLKGTPCTCQDGGCRDTRGFKEHLKDIITEWDNKGVAIDFGIKPTFHLKSIVYNRAFEKASINIK